MKALSIIPLALLLITASCNESSEDEISINANPINLQIDALPVEALNEQENAALLFMKEEEKLARDVYDFLYKTYSIRVFDNISDSEQSHMDAVGSLIIKYSLDDPTGDDIPGKFVNTDLQALYDELVQTGSLGINEALSVGAAIEEIDIIDLQRELETNVDNQDITLVFENLMKGSRNHLRSFVKNLGNRNIIYQPQYLSQEEFDAIINSTF
jgi:hypothetical protein